MKKVLFFEDEFYEFSNWSAHAIDIFGYRFPTADHAYHAKKFIGQNTNVAEQIKNARSPYEAKRIAISNKDKILKNWNGVKVEVFYEILKAKAKQNKDVMKKLLSTGDAIIIENSPLDDFWGRGSNWKGQNMLGKLWMKIRKEFR